MSEGNRPFFSLFCDLSTSAAVQISPHFTGLSIGDSVDELLILLSVATLGDSERLPVCLFGKSRRAHVRDPDLNRSQALLTQPLVSATYAGRSRAQRVLAVR